MQYKRSNNLAGFTLIELMVTLAIAGILLAYAIPSYREFSMRQNMSNETNNFIGDLIFARVTAIDKGARVRVVSVDGKNWEKGWNVSLILPDNSLDVLRTKQALADATTMTATNNVGTITYSSLGVLTAGSVPFSINIQHAPEYPNFITLGVVASGMASSSRNF